MTRHHEYAHMLPDHCRDGLLDYIDRGTPVGGFLTALLSNNLKETFARADTVNSYRVRDYVNFLYNHAPAGCWGSRERVSEWMERGGLQGGAQ